MKEPIKTDKRIFAIMTCLAVGILLRFVVMSRGYNYDFESYSIVGEIAAHFRSVYAETARYNYGFLFFCIQGFLYKLASFNRMDPLMTYRVLMVSVLTLTDLLIAFVVADRFSWKAALLFFLNPVSIIITGYHNQFDNMAILLALLGLYFYNEEQTISKKDWGFVPVMTLSLIMKHILFLMPVFLLFRKNLNWKKRILYACFPPGFFLVSFVPFALAPGAFQGILQNVFLYRSHNNAPLLSWFYQLIHFPNSYQFIVYALLMCALAVLARKESYSDALLLYLIAMVTFSSAIANQYLVIPMVGLVVLETGFWKYVYMVVAAGFLCLEENGLYILSRWNVELFDEYGPVVGNFVKYGYSLCAWILLFALVYRWFKQSVEKKKA